MISKVQGKALSGKTVIASRPKLSAVEKGLLKWAVVDPGDKVLDANIGDGLLAEYLRRNMQCEVCGVSDSMENVRCARGLLQTCDIVYASAGDIPWRERSFDSVFLKVEGSEADAMRKTLKEIWRVLKDGGQIVLGIHGFPTPLREIARAFTGVEDEVCQPIGKQEVMSQLKTLCFEQISWQRTSMTSGVMIGWKHKNHPDMVFNNQ